MLTKNISPYCMGWVRCTFPLPVWFCLVFHERPQSLFSLVQQFITSGDLVGLHNNHKTSIVIIFGEYIIVLVI